MEDPSTIVISNDSSLIMVPADTKVTVQDAVVLELEGHVVAKLDATYDLKNIHPDLRTYAINAAMNARRHLHLLRDRGIPDSKVELQAVL